MVLLNGADASIKYYLAFESSYRKSYGQSFIHVIIIL